MAKTIIQPIGPLYGEVVNGTVFGQPNGSVYVPPDNVVYFTAPSAYIKNSVSGEAYRVAFCTDGGVTLATQATVAMQDLSSNVRLVLSTTASDSGIVATRTYPAGRTNIDTTFVIADYELTEASYYFAIQIMNNGTVIGTSEFVAVGVVA